MTDAAMRALIVTVVGGAITAAGVGAIVWLLHDRFTHFEARSRAAAEERAHVAGRVEEAIAQAARATNYARDALFAQRILDRSRDRDQRIAAETARGARIRRLRAARARRGRW